MKTILVKVLKKIHLYNFIYSFYIKRINKRKKSQIKKNGIEILEKLNSAFKELNLPYWLAFGTLLGAVREKNFISHDLDLDIATWKQSYSGRVSEILLKHGFALKRTIAVKDNIGIEETYSYKGVNVDIFYFERISDEMVKCHSFYIDKSLGYIETINKHGGLFPLEVILPFEGLLKYTFLGVPVFIPDVYEKQLVCHYGEDYMVPDPNWDYTEAPSSKNIEGMIGVVYE